MVVYFHWIPWNLKGYGRGIEGLLGKNVFMPIIPSELLPSLRFYELPAAEYGGGFGVAVFFLITGFVIPASLQRHNPVSFIVGRIFRIYPSHLIALVTISVFLLASGLIVHDVADRFDWWRIFANALLLTDFLRDTPMNPVFWTLLVEIKFYLLAALVAALGGFTSRNTLILGLCCVVVVLGVPVLRPMLRDPAILGLCSIASFTAVNILYILAGTVFYLIYSRRISLVPATIFLLGLMLSFDIIERIAISTSSWWWGLPGKWAALCVFSICILAARRFNATSRTLDFFGDVSYPLYLIHMPIGVVLLGAVSRAAGDVHVALLVTAVVSVGIAWLIHRYVEAPANSYGKRLGGQGALDLARVPVTR